MTPIHLVMLILLVAGFVCTFLPKGPGQVAYNIATFVILLLMLIVGG